MAIILSSCRKNGYGTQPFTAHYILIEGSDSDVGNALVSADREMIPLNDMDIENIVMSDYGIGESDFNQYSLFQIVDNQIKIVNNSGYAFSGLMSEGIMMVCNRDDYIRAIDSHGNVLYTLDQNIFKEPVASVSAYSCGLLKVTLYDESIVFLDKQGKLKFAQQFQFATDFCNGYAIVSDVPDDALEDVSTYRIIDTNGETRSTFICDDSDMIKVSFGEELVCARIGDITTVYDFDGNSVLRTSSIENVYSMSHDGFIFENDDDEFGLMDYEGNILISPSYSQLIFNGDILLGINEDQNEDVVIVMDTHEKVLRRYMGNFIVDFAAYNINFPSIISNENEICLIDINGRPIGNPIRGYEIDEYDIDDAMISVESQHIAYDELVATAMELCGNGVFENNPFDLFILSDRNTKCHAPAIMEAADKKWPQSIFTKRKDYTLWIKNGLNYTIFATAIFSDNIALNDENWDPNATLESYGVKIEANESYQASELMQYLRNDFRKAGCFAIDEAPKGTLFIEKDKKHLFAVYSKGKDCIIEVFYTTNNNVSRLSKQIHSL